jgi:hypothetical protein
VEVVKILMAPDERTELGGTCGGIHPTCRG